MSLPLEEANEQNFNSFQSGSQHGRWTAKQIAAELGQPAQKKL